MMGYDSPTTDRQKLVDTYLEAAVYHDFKLLSDLVSTHLESAKFITFTRPDVFHRFRKSPFNSPDSLDMQYIVSKQLGSRLANLVLSISDYSITQLILSLLENEEGVRTFVGEVGNTAQFRTEIDYPAQELHLEYSISEAYPYLEHLLLFGSETEGYKSYIRLPADPTEPELQEIALFIPNAYGVLRRPLNAQDSILIAKRILGTDIEEIHLPIKFDSTGTIIYEYNSAVDQD